MPAISRVDVNGVIHEVKDETARSRSFNAVLTESGWVVNPTVGNYSYNLIIPAEHRLSLNHHPFVSCEDDDKSDYNAIHNAYVTTMEDSQVIIFEAYPKPMENINLNIIDLG